MSSQIAIKFAAGYTGMGILSYNLVAPVFDALSGYMPPCAFKYCIYGVMWPLPTCILIGNITYIIYEKIFG